MGDILLGGALGGGWEEDQPGEDALVITEGVAPETLSILTTEQLRRCAEIASGLAKRAAGIHKAAIEEATSWLWKFMDERQSALRDAGTGRFGITVRAVRTDKNNQTHVVSMSEFADKETCVAHHLEIAVTTDLSLEGSEKGMTCGYRTKTRAIFEDVISELAQDRYVGATVI